MSRPFWSRNTTCQFMAEPSDPARRAAPPSRNTRVEGQLQPSFRARNPSCNLNLIPTPTRRCLARAARQRRCRSAGPDYTATPANGPPPEPPNSQLSLHAPFFHHCTRRSSTTARAAEGSSRPAQKRPFLTNPPLCSRFASLLILLHLHPPASTAIGPRQSPGSAQTLRISLSNLPPP